VRFVVQVSVFGRIALATFFGLLIGLEREARGKAAGERTFALLALGAAGFTAVGVELFPASAEKVIAGVATGVGFLGAGIIFRAREGSPRGLTTAASSWAATAVGVLCGSALYLSAALTTGLTILILEADRLPVLSQLLRLAKHEEPGGPPATEL